MTTGPGASRLRGHFLAKMEGTVRGGKEKPAEEKLIAALHRKGFWAKHMDTNVDGFFDILAQRGGVVYVIEVKDDDRTKYARNLFEPTQPVFAHRWKAQGGDSYLACELKGQWKVYDASDALDMILVNEDLLVNELPILKAGNADDIAYYFRMGAQHGG
jgi:Holliday junction resolvase